MKVVITWLSADKQRLSYLNRGQFVPGIERVVDRDNLYEDVIDMYGEGEVVQDYPLVVKYRGEKAIDYGGVQRDLFSAF